MAKKKKKEKIVYVDDNSTVVDMRAANSKGEPQPPKQKSTFKDKLHTYFASVKMMLIPMIAVLSSMIVIYLLLLAITGKL